VAAAQTRPIPEVVSPGAPAADPPASRPDAPAGVPVAVAGELAPQAPTATQPGSPGAVGTPPTPDIPADAGSAAIALHDAVVPIDVRGLGAAVSELLSGLDTVRSEVEAVLPETEYAIVLLGVAVGLGGYEVARRRQVRTAPTALPSPLATEPM
jgi:hypothetical protein